MLLATVSPARVALAVPPLRQVLCRAIHPSPSAPAFGMRPNQRRDGGPGSDPRAKSGSYPSRGKSPSSSDRERPLRSTRAGSADRSVPSTPTTSRRLAPLPPRERERPPHFGRPSRSPSPQSSLPTSLPKLPPRPPSASEPRPFRSFPLHATVLSAISEHLGDSSPTTAIQSLSLANIRVVSPENPLRAILGAETGSGKTLAYLLPIFNHLKSTDAGPNPSKDPDAPLAPRAVIISPTHELTRQSTAVAKALAHSVKLGVVGGSSSTKGLRGWAGETDLVFATGGTLRSMFKGGVGENSPEDEMKELREGPARKRVPMRLDRVEWLVIDEADVMLGPDFAEETLSTLSHFPPGINILLVTATLPPSLLHHVTTSPPLSSLPFEQHLSPGMHGLPKKLSTQFVGSTGGNLPAEVARQIKLAFAEDDLNPAQATRRKEGVGGSKVKTKAVVFCNSDSRVRSVARTLGEKGLDHLAWTGEAEQRILGKNGALDGFLKPVTAALSSAGARSSEGIPSGGEGKQQDIAPSEVGVSFGAPRVLVTTSLLSRGLDFAPFVSTVVLVDPPRDALDFVHRAGRAGRAGRTGRVIVFGMGDGRDLGGRGGVGKGVKEVVRKGKGHGRVSGGSTAGGRREGSRPRIARR